MLAIAGIGVAAASAYYWARKPRPSQPPFDLQHQTIVEVNNKTLKNTVRLSSVIIAVQSAEFPLSSPGNRWSLVEEGH
jgi:hypothetical protein